MPQIDKVPNMKKAPGKCGICHTTPMEGGKPLPAIDTNVDVDWGNNLYICDECVRVIGELMGWVTPEEFAKLKAEHDQLKDDHQRLRTRFKTLQERATKMAEGQKAAKVQRAKSKKRRAA